MIIYYAMTKYHLIFSIVHKLMMHRDENAVLFLYSGLQDLDTNYSRLKEIGYFTDVYIVPEIEFRKSWTALREDASDAEVNNNINAMVQVIEEWLPIPITGKDELYIANDHWAIGTYCIHKGIPYVYYEDGVGMLSKPEYSYELVKKLNTTHAVMARRMGAFGLNKYVKYKLADLDNQSEGFYDEKAVHFSLKENLQKLPSEDMKNLLYIFNAPNCGDAENATILLTEHFVNMKRLTIEGQQELYAILVDLFGEGDKLFIKPHPNDFQINYMGLFKDAKIIARTFPSELLPYCFDNKLSLALAACSTSVYGLKNVVNNTLRFDIDIENHYQSMFKYYALSKIVEKLNGYGVLAIGAYQDILNAYNIEFGTDLKDIAGKKVVVVDDRELQSDLDLNWLGKKDILIYLNSLEKNIFFQNDENKKYLENCILFKIAKRNISNTRLINKESEYIYVFTNDKFIKLELEKIREEKNMEYCGTILDVEAMTDNLKMQVKILEGNLKAANYRIEKYKEQEEAYKTEIELLKAKLENRDSELIESLKSVLENERNGGI